LLSIEGKGIISSSQIFTMDGGNTCQSFDVTIIGAGVTGCFIAKELSKYKLKTLVIEKEPTVGTGPTKGSSGIIHAFQLPFGSLKGKLCLEGNRLMDEEAKELGFRFKRVGLLLVCKSVFSSLVARILKLYFSRYVEVRYLGREEIRKLERHVKGRGGLYFPSGGVVNPVEMTFKAKRFAELNGVEFWFERRVVGIEMKDKKFEITIESDEGLMRIVSSFVINCAGLYADEVAAMVGDKLKIIPGKGSHVVFEDKDFSSHLIAALPLMPERRTKGGGSLVTIDGNLIWGPSLIDVKDKEDRSVKKEEVEGLLKKHSRVFERMPAKAVSVYAGVRAIAGRDFVINSPVRNFINVAGIQSPGLTAAPAISRLVLKMLEKMLEQNGLKLERKGEVKLVERRKSREGELLCHCRVVPLAEVREIIAEGAGTLDDIKHLTGASMECGRCLPKILEVMDEEGLPLRKDTCKSQIAWRDR
jgi:glycerol-3-phosphate dehydrogenase